MEEVAERRFSELEKSTVYIKRTDGTRNSLSDIKRKDLKE